MPKTHNSGLRTRGGEASCAEEADEEACQNSQNSRRLIKRHPSWRSWSLGPLETGDEKMMGLKLSYADTDGQEVWMRGWYSCSRPSGKVPCEHTYDSTYGPKLPTPWSRYGTLKVNGIVRSGKK